MKILFFVDGFRAGGKERRCIELLKGLKENPEFEINIVSLREEIVYEEFYQLNYPYTLIEKKVKLDPSIFFSFFKLCKKIKPDIVHCWSSMNSTYALLAKFLLRFKLINSQITDAPNKIKWFSQFGIQTKLNFLFSDTILANSFAGLKSYNAPNNKSICIHNGFDINRIRELERPESIRREFNIKTKHIVSMVGAFAERKDYETYIRVAEQVCSKRNDVTFLGIGDGVNLERLRELIENIDRIILPGRKSNVESVINASDICVLMTNADVHGEGISNSIMEYMALGKPVIASKSGGTSEIVQNDVTGFIVENKSEEELKRKILCLLNNPSRRIEMGILGKHEIKKSFNMSLMLKSFNKLYKEVNNAN